MIEEGRAQVEWGRGIRLRVTYTTRRKIAIYEHEQNLAISFSFNSDAFSNIPTL